MKNTINNTYRDYPKTSCIHEQFEHQARVRENHTAVLLPIIKDNHLHTKDVTYGELNRRADILLQKLISEGIQKNSIIALYMDRSIEMIVALLGILKAGCAYLPLDPAYPIERLTFMLKDAQAPLIITQSHLVSNLPENQTPMMIMNDDWGCDMPIKDRKFDSVIQGSDSLAYINYTSGSTGRPKGVKIPHRGVLRLIFGADYSRLDENQTILQLAPISFDAATFEIWGALMLGGKCVLFPYNGIPDPNELKMVIDEYKITRLWLTSSLFNLIMDVMPEALKGASEILTGGEVLSVGHIKKALKLLPDCQIINGYGPTESTTFTCCYRIPRELDDNVISIPIGHPISNTQVYIFDKDMKPMPVNEVGELYIGGDGLADGYLNLPDLTSERFIPDPYNNGEILYKTGDLVRLLPEGEIEFVGRSDDQVKINGFRIELGEIESVLRKHHAVRDALVIAEKDGNGTKYLMGFVTAQNKNDMDIEDVKIFIGKNIAQFMIPRDIVLLDVIPLNPNGKIDRQAILKSWKAKELDYPDYMAPNSDSEKKLSMIWLDILNKDKISINSNFFEIGGTSILSVKLMKKVSQEFNTEIPVIRLYHYPTIKSLANYITNGEPTSMNVSKTQDRAKLQREALSRRKDTGRRQTFK